MIRSAQAIGVGRRDDRLAVLAKLVMGVAALALSAKIRIPLAPVPLTLQTLAVLLVGAMLGRRAGLAAVGAYLAAGLSGLPVFASGAGPGYLLGPTGGYLLGLLPAAYLAGLAVESGLGGWRLLGGLLLADASVFVPGLAWLAIWQKMMTGGVSSNLLSVGLLACLPGEAVKMLVAALALRRRW